jgi:hypothetical protein
LLFKNIKIKVYRTIILPVVLYGCETWSLILRVKHKLKVFENRVLRRMFGTERDEVTGEWRSLMICTPHQILFNCQIVENWMDGTCSTYAGEEGCIQGFGVDTRGKETTWKTQA